MQMDTEGQSPSPSHVTNQVESPGAFNRIVNAGHNINIVKADHDIHVQETQMDTEGQSPSPSHVTNQVESPGAFNRILNAGHNINIVKADNDIHVHVHVHVHSCSGKKFETRGKSRGNQKKTTARGNNVARPLPRAARLNAPKQRAFKKSLDELNMLLARGKLKKCDEERINRMFENTTDPNCLVMLWTAVAANRINGGEMEDARDALRQVKDLLDQTENSSEHELALNYYQSLIYLREDRYDSGVRVITMALVNIQMKQVGHMRALLLLNLGWLYTKMASLEQDCYKQAELIKDAKELFERAIDEEDFAGQLHDQKTRIRQCALIGHVYLQLRCWRSVSDNKQGNMDDIPQEDIQEAQKILVSLEDRERLCGICEVLYHLAKAHLCYRFKQYPQALKEAEAARDLAIHGQFKNYIDIAESIVKLFRQAVTRTCTCGWHLLPA